MFKVLAFLSLFASVTSMEVMHKVKHAFIQNKNKVQKQNMISPQSVSGTFPSNPVYGYVNTYLDADACSGDVALTEAVLLNTCLVSATGYSMFTCADDGMTVTSYSDSDCTIAGISGYYAATNDCQSGDFVQAICKTSSDPYKYMNKKAVGSYFNSEDCSSDIVYTQGYNINECTTIEGFGSYYIDFPTMSVFEGVLDCSGEPSDEQEAPTTCTVSDDDYDYNALTYGSNFYIQIYSSSDRTEHLNSGEIIGTALGASLGMFVLVVLAIVIYALYCKKPESGGAPASYEATNANEAGVEITDSKA